MTRSAFSPASLGPTAEPTGALDTFPKLLLHHQRVRPDRPANREKDYGIWQSWSWAEVAAEVEALACGLAMMGFHRGEIPSLPDHRRVLRPLRRPLPSSSFARCHNLFRGLPAGPAAPVGDGGAVWERYPAPLSAPLWDQDLPARRRCASSMPP